METRKQYVKRIDGLKKERATWVPHWTEINEYIEPWAGRFPGGEKNSGAKKHGHIINSTASWAARTLDSGMMAGISSPSRPWFRLATPDPDLNEFGAVKAWLHVVESRVRLALARSNVYNGLHSVYGSLGRFGVAALHVEEDEEKGLRAYFFPVGSYCLANSSRQRVDTCARDRAMTVAQLAQKFGLEKCSLRVRDMYARGHMDAWVDVVHLVEPRRDYQPGKLGPEGKPWRSCWFEAGASEEEGLLLEAGFDEFPIMAPRWTVTGEDVYGSSPGMAALGDCKALQVLEKRKAQAVDKLVNPPMRAPWEMQNRGISLLPGAVNFGSGASASSVLSPAVEVNPHAVPAVEASIREHEGRIKTAFYADLWLALSMGDSPQMTAREVAERHEEKMLQLGPVMERLQDELLDPLIDRVFNILLRNGDLPPPPEELQGQELRVEYLSALAQAQKVMGKTAVDSLVGYVLNIAQAKPEVLDKLDVDQSVDEYANMLGVPPALVRSDEDVAAIREARAQQAAQQQQMEKAGAAVQGAQTLSQTDTGGDNALTRLLGALGAPPPSGT